MVHKILFNLTRFAVLESLVGVLAGLWGALRYVLRARAAGYAPETGDVVFVFVIYAVSLCVGVVWRIIANATPLRWLWAYVLLGVGLILLDVLYLSQPTSILDIFLIPLGIGIAAAGAGSFLHRWKAAPPVGAGGATGDMDA